MAAAILYLMKQALGYLKSKMVGFAQVDPKHVGFYKRFGFHLMGVGKKERDRQSERIQALGARKISRII